MRSVEYGLSGRYELDQGWGIWSIFLNEGCRHKERKVDLEMRGWATITFKNYGVYTKLKSITEKLSPWNIPLQYAIISILSGFSFT